MPKKPDNNLSLEKKLPLYFGLFNEIGIINQLSTASLDNLMPKGLMHTHFSVLNHLIRLGDGSTPLEIANAFQVPKTTMTHTISGLQKHKLVNILRNPNDGRSKQVWLTEQGKNLRLEVIQSAAPKISKYLEGFSDPQIETLYKNLTEIRKIMDSNR